MNDLTIERQAELESLISLLPRASSGKLAGQNYTASTLPPDAAPGLLRYKGRPISFLRSFNTALPKDPTKCTVNLEMGRSGKVALDASVCHVPLGLDKVAMNERRAIRFIAQAQDWAVTIPQVASFARSLKSDFISVTHITNELTEDPSYKWGIPGELLTTGGVYRSPTWLPGYPSNAAHLAAQASFKYEYALPQWVLELCTPARAFPVGEDYTAYIVPLDELEGLMGTI